MLNQSVLKYYCFYFFLFLFVYSVYGQDVKRVSLNGVVYADTNDVQNVTVFNKSSNKGTITDADGVFTLEVTINDRIEISAIQFQSATVIIDEDAIVNKRLIVQLIEQVHNLDAVLLSNGLSGNINEDIANIKEVKPIVLDMGNMDVDFDYNDDKAYSNEVVHDHLRSVINRNDRKYMPDFKKILKLIMKSKKRKPKSKTKPKNEQTPNQIDHNILDVYSKQDVSDIYNIPITRVDAFINYLNNDIPVAFFQKKNEIQLIELLVNKSVEFLRKENVKN